MSYTLTDLNQIIHQDCMERSCVLNLNASENHMSQLARNPLASHPAYDCYEFPPSGGVIKGPWQFSGPPYNEKIVEYIQAQCLDLLGSSHVNVRPRGGQAAEIAVLLGLANTGDSVFYVSEKSGGHFGLTEMAKHCGIHLCPLVFGKDSQLIDLDKTIGEMKRIWSSLSSKVCIINQSFILREQNWGELVRTFKKNFPDMIITCDVSHLLGLIIGGEIQNPLNFGVDIIHGSTHKTFPGPQKALIIYHSELGQDKRVAIDHAVSPLLQSSCGTAEIIALAYVFAEMEIFGEVYAKATCENARYFASHLADLKLNIVKGVFNHTQTHQVWLVVGDEQEAWKVYSLLHSAGLRALPAFLPFVEEWGIRFGVNALTRRGFQSDQFALIAGWVEGLINYRLSVVDVRQYIRDLCYRFPLSDLSYTFDRALLAEGSRILSSTVTTS